MDRGPAAMSMPLNGRVQFSVRDVVTVELQAATRQDVRVVTAQLGPPADTGAEPDIIVRFVDRLKLGSSLTSVGFGEAGYDATSFYLLKTTGNTATRVRIPFDQIGQRCEIVCEHGLPAIPLLVAIVNLTALARGALPLHASAVRFRDRSLLATGWSKGGKTESVLALAALGAEYISDEWTYIVNDGTEILGLPEPIRLWNWQLQQLPAVRRKLSRRERARLVAVQLGGDAFLRAGRSNWAGARVLRRAQPIVARQGNIRVPPHELFGGRMVEGRSPLDIVLFVQTHDSPNTVIESIPGGEVSRRMLHSLAHERLAFTALYQQYRYAFPDRSSRVVESAGCREAQLLSRAFDNRNAFMVKHPYPVDLKELGNALVPLFEP